MRSSSLNIREPMVRNLFRYLQKIELLDTESLVRGGILIGVHRSRNLICWVKQKNGPSYFIKKSLPSEVKAVESLSREAAVYSWLQGEESCQSLRDMFPRFYHYDAKDSVLVIELIENADDIGVVHRQAAVCPKNIASALGATLGLYHFAFQEAPEQLKNDPLFPGAVPWFFGVFNPGFNRLQFNSTRSSRLFAGRLWEDEKYAFHIQNLRDGWCKETLIHSDMKWENCLMAGLENDAGKVNLRFIDWEFADFGDPAWDIAGLLQSYFGFGLRGAAVDWESAEPDISAILGGRFSVGVTPALRELFDGYFKTRPLDPSTADELIERSVRLTGVSLLVSLYQALIHQEYESTLISLYMDMALALLERPGSIVSSLGLKRRAS